MDNLLHRNRPQPLLAFCRPRSHQWWTSLIRSSAKGLNHANKTAGVNVNILAADGPEKLDKISGMAHLTGIVVDVKAAEGVLQANWSGM